jgi:hypothetical protein
MKKIYLFLGFWAALLSANAQTVATFDDVELEPVSWYNGSDGTGGFESGGIWFPNDFDTEWQSWSGFSVSNMKDTITPGYENQYSAITGGGVAGSENYAVIHFPGDLQMEFDSAMEVTGFNITNSTYAYLAMRDGGIYGFAKKFGGTDGTDPDYLKLMAWGLNEQGNLTDTMEFFLADYRFENSANDYLVNTWEWMNLNSLGKITRLHFAMESSDTGDWGMNTPAYFCIDNFTSAELTSSAIASSNRNQKPNAYPNPVKSHLQVELPDYQGTITVISLSGKTLYKKEVKNSGKVRIADFENFPSGIYLLNVKTRTENFIRKIVKN